MTRRRRERLDGAGRAGYHGSMGPVDLRSDTVTRPTPAMKEAMIRAPLGDDVFGDDPTVNLLQERVADLLGKEAALFVPSGTMANQLALRAHTQTGDEIIAHARCHILNYESGAAAALAGVQIRPVDSEDGSLPVAAVEALVHQTDDPHYAPTTLITFENTHNGCGGCVVPPANVEAVTTLARTRGIATHLDGARLFNAAIASGTAVGRLAQAFDTVSVCFSKGLGAPVGSCLAGSAGAIARAFRFRKMYGGAMRQAGVLAAAALHAVDHHVGRLADDHRRARRLAEALSGLGFELDLARVHSNIVYFALPAGHALATADVGLVARLAAAGVLITGGTERMRAVLHLDVDDVGLERAIAAFERVLE